MSLGDITSGPGAVFTNTTNPPVTADVLRELALRDQIAEVLHRQGCRDDGDGGSCGGVCVDDADALVPLIADAEKRAAAKELRAIGRAGLAASPGAHPVRVPVSYLFDRAAALDPAGAASGETGR